MKKLFVLLAAVCFAPGAFAAEPALITGAGATFPYPLYSKWFSDYNKLHPDVRINYQSIGSGGGIKQISEKTLDFGASDAPMTEEELKKAPGIAHVPTVLGAVVIAFNVPGVTELNLSGETLAAIFLGKITQWNDAALVKENPKAKLPATAIAVAHRADGSGTTAVFTDYLGKVSAEWKSKVGVGKSVKWPAGMGGKGNEGVTGLVKQTPGTIGYVELAYANQNKLAVAALQSVEGTFVKPSIESITQAGARAVVPEDFRVSITNAPGKDAYPISAFTYLLVYKNQTDARKGQAFLTFISWAVHDGQGSASKLDYAPLPATVVTKVDAALKTFQVAGSPFHGTK